MKSDILILRENIVMLEGKLKRDKEKLDYLVSTCQHKWSEPVEDHIYHEAYTTKGDAPGTMGVDWQGPMYIPAQTIKRWKRTCSYCGEVQHTNNTNIHITEIPKFS